MNIQAYIESGILEAYALDALTPEESREVAGNIARYPELAAEFEAIEQRLLTFAQAGAEPPPPHLKEHIWETVSAEQARKGPFSAPPKPEPKVIALPPPARPSWQRAAVWAAVLVSVLTNIMLLSQKNKIAEEQNVLRQQMDSVMLQSRQLAQIAANDAREKELLADTTMQAVVMKTMKPGHPMAATVYWSRQGGDAYLSIQKMPMPPAGMQYQLWVIRDGEPVSMGVIANDMVASGAVMKMPSAKGNSQAFAISLEREGGSPAPTMEEIQVLGKPI